MSKVDWSLAPEGATHWDASDFRINSFMKFDGAKWFYWPPASAEPHWCRWGDNSKQDINGMIERPKPAQWSGPQDGLPPVGTVCEVRINFTPWQEVEIIAHFKNKAMVAAFIPVGDVDKRVNQAIADCFRPIKTTEQLAAEQRETAIREIMDIAYVDCRVTAARLVDAGFKREVV
jgi:hypothetical protein